MSKSMTSGKYKILRVYARRKVVNRIVEIATRMNLFRKRFFSFLGYGCHNRKRMPPIIGPHAQVFWGRVSLISYCVSKTLNVSRSSVSLTTTMEVKGSERQVLGTETVGINFETSTEARRFMGKVEQRVRQCGLAGTIVNKTCAKNSQMNSSSFSCCFSNWNPWKPFKEFGWEIQSTF